MRKLITITICLVCVLTTVASAALSVSFDENGNGTFNGSPLIWAVAPSGIDPTPPGPIPTLFYGLPFTVVPGDVQIIEPDGTVSDVLRFINPSGTGIPAVFVYSDSDPTAPDYDLADTMLPQPWPGVPIVVMTEIGTENGWNGVSYTPGPNDPGAPDASVGPVTYDFTSDVPEPATLGLLAIGALTLRRRK